METTLPPHYRSAYRVLIRFAIVMAGVFLVAGILFQESSKRLTWQQAGAGLRLEAVLPLGLVHGHVFTAAVLAPLVFAAALHLARRAGGAEVPPRTLAWLTRGYLPFVVLTLGLLLYKGYHVLLAVRGGARDLGAVDASHFGGFSLLRHALYGVAHVGLALCLVVFLVGLWRSLGTRRAKAGPAAR